MAKTEKLGLNTWSETDNSGTWLAWRLAMAGTSSDSNMQILDAWAKAVDEKIANVQSTLTFDETPTAGSENPVTSGGIKAALDTKQDGLSFDEVPTAGSDNPVTSGGVYDALQAHVSKPDLTIRCTFDDTSSAAACQNSTVFAYSADEVRATYEKLAAADEQPVVVSMYGDVQKGGATEGHTLSVTDVSSAAEQLHVSFLLTPSLIEGLEHVFHAELTFSVGGGSVTLSFVVEPIDGTTDIGLDDVPTEGSENLVTSGGVWEALNDRAKSTELSAHTGDSALHVTASNKSTWNAKQNSITVTGILKGNGNGGVSAAVEGVDYAAAEHDHDGEYCTPETLETILEGALQGKAPAFSSVVRVDVTVTEDLYLLPEHQGKFIIMHDPAMSQNLQCFVVAETRDDLPVGFECEVMSDMAGTLCIATDSQGTLVTTADKNLGRVELQEQYSVAVMKKIGEREWLVGGALK